MVNKKMRHIDANADEEKGSSDAPEEETSLL